MFLEWRSEEEKACGYLVEVFYALNREWRSLFFLWKNLSTMTDELRFQEMYSGTENYWLNEAVEERVDVSNVLIFFFFLFLSLTVFYVLHGASSDQPRNTEIQRNYSEDMVENYFLILLNFLYTVFKTLEQTIKILSITKVLIHLQEKISWISNMIHTVRFNNANWELNKVRLKNYTLKMFRKYLQGKHTKRLVQNMKYNLLLP